MAKLKQISKTQIATSVAVLFHIVGLVGILIFKSELIIRSTPFTLLLSFALLVWTQEEKNGFFWLFAIVVMGVGFTAEVIGVNTGWLFGDYRYGDVLGVKWLRVPLMIGINWFIIIYCCGISIHALVQIITKPVTGITAVPSTRLQAFSIITDGATMAVVFDWLIEPVAVRLDFWQWHTGVIPLYNYVCWFVISVLLLLLFRLCRFSKENKFAVNLLLIQFIFFLLLRTFYHTK